eukprot:jgi/Mesvir1/20469/Mv12359-RA.1
MDSLSVSRNALCFDVAKKSAALPTLCGSRLNYSTAKRPGLCQLRYPNKVATCLSQAGPNIAVSYPFTNAPLKSRQNRRNSAIAAKPRGFGDDSGPEGRIKKLAQEVSEKMSGINFYVVGPSTDANNAIVQVVAPLMGYTPILCSELVARASGHASVEAFLDHERTDPLALASLETSVLGSLATEYVRLAVATVGADNSAAHHEAAWRFLHGGLSVWLKVGEPSLSPSPGGADPGSGRDPSADFPDSSTLAKADLRVLLPVATWSDDLRLMAAEACLTAAKKAIKDDKDLCGKKSLYVRLGCRGDWPTLQPPGWDPDAPQASASDAAQHAAT